MSRTFLPALRGIAPTPVAPEGVEGKSVTLTGPTLLSRYTYGGTAGDAPGARAAEWDMTRAVVEGFERVVWVYRCVELLSDDCSRLPYRIGRHRDTPDEEVMLEHPLYRVLNRRANPLEKGKAFRKRLVAQVLLSKKGAFVEVTKNRGNKISRLDLLDPNRVTVVPSDNGEYIERFDYQSLTGELRPLDPQSVRWVRNPHPTDPLSGTTPLEAAGLSVQLDFLSRLYNTNFITNDARPGGVLGVDADGLDDSELNRIESKLEPGVHAAGKMTVLGTGPGGLSYVDTTTKPRDMAYSEASSNAKAEILAAFGIGEAVLGTARGSTFDNAENEIYTYYTGPVSRMNDLITDAFDDDIEGFDDGWEGFIDTSSVQALELPRRRQREEARTEFQAGLRSIDEYRPLAGLTVVGSAQSRALWVSPAKAPVPANPEDAAELGVTPAGAPVEDGAGGEVPPGGGEPGTAGADAVAAARAEGAEGEGGPAADAVAAARAEGDNFPGTAGADAVAAAQAEAGGDEFELDTPAADAVLAAREGKSLESPTDEDYQRVAMGVAATLEAALSRQAAIITARMQAPKAKANTRYWEPSGPNDPKAGDGPLNIDHAVQSERLQAEAGETVHPLVASGATEAGSALLAGFAGAGLFGAAVYTADDFAAAASKATVGLASQVTLAAMDAIGDFLSGVRVAIVTAEAGAGPLQDVVDAVDAYYAEHTRAFVEDVADMVAYATVNGAREAAAEVVLPAPTPGGIADVEIVREWVTRGDSRVREAHAMAAGMVLPVGEPFTMAGGSVRYPRDPMGSPALTYGCRCRLSYSTRAAGPAMLPFLD